MFADFHKVPEINIRGILDLGGLLTVCVLLDPDCVHYNIGYNSRIQAAHYYLPNTPLPLEDNVLLS